MDKRSKEALAVKRAEQAFDHKRRTIGLFGGPLSALRSLHRWAYAASLDAAKCHLLCFGVYSHHKNDPYRCHHRLRRDCLCHDSIGHLFCQLDGRLTLT